MGHTALFSSVKSLMNVKHRMGVIPVPSLISLFISLSNSGPILLSYFFLFVFVCSFKTSWDISGAHRRCLLHAGVVCS